MRGPCRHGLRGWLGSRAALCAARKGQGAPGEVQEVLDLRARQMRVRAQNLQRLVVNVREGVIEGSAVGFGAVRVEIVSMYGCRE